MSHADLAAHRATPSDQPLADAEILARIERRVLWLSTWMIHHANHIRPVRDGEVKVGGHQASSASMATILTALYFHVLRPEDRVAVKPHASPAFHAIQYLAGRQSREKLERFRALGGAQSYPSRTKDGDMVDFSTGSVGLGVAQTLFSSLAQDYVEAHGGLAGREAGRMVALVGDAELDEGNVTEALMEGWKHALRNCWWVIDYNRQSLDGIVQEGLWERLVSTFRTFGWDVVVLRHGRLQEAAFAEPGGEALRRWIEACPNPLYSALCFQGGAAWRERLLEDLGDQGDVRALIERRSDEALHALMSNLGGHDIGSLIESFSAASSDRPTVFLCYTVKGFGLPLAGHKDNHAGLLTPAQMDLLRDSLGVREGHEWDPWEGEDEAALQTAIQAAPFFAPGPRHLTCGTVAVPETLALPRVSERVSTQTGFGQILNEIGRAGGPLAERIVTTSPDVTVSTNLGAWVNRRGVFDRDTRPDMFKERRIPSTFAWSMSPRGQHIELGIAEANLFLLLSALGLSHSINGHRLLPIGTVYDPFIYRGADQLNYACYQDARFMIVATPSGVTLAPEGGAHQSIGTPLIGMAQDRLASFEPAFLDELAVIMRWGFEHMQREGSAKPAIDGLDDAAGGSLYLRLSSRPIEQPHRPIEPSLAAEILAGGYWMRRPQRDPRVVIAYTGAMAPEAFAAAAELAGGMQDVGLLAITSADRLHKGWTGARQRRASGLNAEAQVERLLGRVPRDCRIVTVCDGHPTTLSWLGAVAGNRVAALGVTAFGQSGSIADVHAAAGIDAAAIVAAAHG